MNANNYDLIFTCEYEHETRINAAKMKFLRNILEVMIFGCGMLEKEPLIAKIEDEQNKLFEHVTRIKNGFERGREIGRGKGWAE